MPITIAMRCAGLLLLICFGCAWKPKPYARDPMGKIPLVKPAPATVEPMTAAWPSPPEPPAKSEGPTT